MGRIKELESEIRKAEKSRAEYLATRGQWVRCSEMTDEQAQTAQATALAYVEHGDYVHPRTGKKTYLYAHTKSEGEHADPLNGAELCALWLSKHGPLAGEGPWLTHYRMRLAYENQMLEAQGGRAAFVEMEAGGFLGSHQVQRVYKSPATGRVCSVEIWGPSSANYDRKGKAYGEDNPRPLTLHKINVERMASNAYRAPTDEERAAFLAETKAAKKAATAKRALNPCPLVNPSDEDAERLQEIWNEKARTPEQRQKVVRMDQAQYSARSSGTYCSCKTVVVCETGREHTTRMGSKITRSDVFKVRCTSGAGNSWVDRVIVITDKPRTAVPWEALEKARLAAPSVEKLWARLPEISLELGKSWLEDTNRQLLSDAECVGWVDIQSSSQFYFTEKGRKALADFQSEDKAPAVEAVPVVPVVVDAVPRVQAEFALV
jgi:hypothetical protein